MKIAVDVTPILPGGEGGGAKQVIFELLRGFCKKRGAEKYILLTSYANHDIFAEFEQFGMKRICVINNKPFAQKRAIWRIFFNIFNRTMSSCSYPSILKRERVSLLFCPMTAPTFYEDGIPTVCTIHDLQHVVYPYFFSPEELAYRNDFYDKLKLSADFIICVSSFTRETVINKLNIPSERVKTIHNCVYNRFNLPNNETVLSVLSRYGVKDKTYCFYPANFWPHKNHKMLLTAFNMLLRKNPELRIELVLTGSRTDENKSVIIDDAIKQMKLSDKVHLLGYLSDEELAAIWIGASFLVFPSLYEGFGIPLLEAMFFVKPIICSNVTSLPEVGGEAAIYFDPRRPDEIVKAMESVINDKELYKALVLKGKEQLQKFNYESMVNQYISVFYESVKLNLKKEYYNVNGIYSDRWVGEKLYVSYGLSNNLRLIRTELLMPDWHPNLKSIITVINNGKKIRKYIIKKGEKVLIEEELPRKEGSFKLHISHGFIPNNGDTRKLTLIVNNFYIIDKEKNNFILYSHGEKNE